jgi:hypothetical protein
LESAKKIDLPSGKTIKCVRLEMMDEAEEYSPNGFSRLRHGVFRSKSKYEFSVSSSLESEVPSQIKESTCQFTEADAKQFSYSKSIVDKHK